MDWRMNKMPLELYFNNKNGFSIRETVSQKELSNIIRSPIMKRHSRIYLLPVPKT